MPEQDQLLRCYFCGKSQDEVRRLFFSPLREMVANEQFAGDAVNICDECVEICNEIISDEEETSVNDKAESANLILKLYELRREETMREARDWFSRFDPRSAQDVMSAVMNPQSSAFYRMVTSYWDMACSFAANGAIDEEMFNAANAEHVFVFSKIEPHLAELRTMFNSPGMLKNLEAVVMRQPDATQKLEAMRERSRRMAAMRAQARNDAAQAEAATT